jgi:hypothetical protein
MHRRAVSGRLEALVIPGAYERCGVFIHTSSSVQQEMATCLVLLTGFFADN